MIGDCQIVVKKIICGGITERFVLAKFSSATFRNFHKFVENRAQSPTCKFKMSAVCVAERLLTARPRLSSCIKHVNVSILKLPLH